MHTEKHEYFLKTVENNSTICMTEIFSCISCSNGNRLQKKMCIAPRYLGHFIKLLNAAKSITSGISIREKI